MQFVAKWIVEMSCVVVSCCTVEFCRIPTTPTVHYVLHTSICKPWKFCLGPLCINIQQNLGFEHNFYYFSNKQTAGPLWPLKCLTMIVQLVLSYHTKSGGFEWSSFWIQSHNATNATIDRDTTKIPVDVHSSRKYFDLHSFLYVIVHVSATHFTVKDLERLISTKYSFSILLCRVLYINSAE